VHLTLAQVALVLLTFLIPVPAIYLTLRYITGKIPRHYNTLPFTDSVTIAERGMFLEEFVTKYAPALVLHSELEEPEACLFEVVEQEEFYIINYWYFWHEEFHPNKIIDEVYRILRHTYYGSKTAKDAEPVQVTISKQTGHIYTIKFRTDPRNRFDIFLPKRTPAIVKQVDSKYVYTVGGIEQEISPDFMDATQIKLTIQTWNHLFTLSKTGTPLEVPLLWLDEKLYKELKITRRKGGKETIKDWVITLILIFTIIGVWTVLIFI
jgi:hypothetical protein